MLHEQLQSEISDSKEAYNRVQAELSELSKKHSSSCAEYESSLTSTVSEFESQIAALQADHQKQIGLKDDIILQVSLLTIVVAMNLLSYSLFSHCRFSLKVD
jgi:chromosome segregation ATPase